MPLIKLKQGQTFFYFSSFKNPDRTFSRNGKTIEFNILFFDRADRMKIVPNLKKKRTKLSTKVYFI